MKKILASLALTALTTLGCLTIPNDAFAQDTETIKPNVNLTAPDGWDNKEDETKNNLIAVYVDPKSEHRIEVMARRNTSPKHAKALFEAFHTELKKTFTPQKDETEQSYQLKDGSTRKGQYITYETRDADVPISVITYAFVTDKENTENHNIDNIAYIVVGYFANAKREEGQKVFESFIQSMTDI